MLTRGSIHHSDRRVFDPQIVARIYLPRSD